MKTSIASVSVRGDMAEKLRAVASAGFDGIEIFENDLLSHGGSAREVGRMARDLGLEITLLQPLRDFEGLPEPHRARAFDRAERMFDVMTALESELLLVCSNVSPIACQGVERAAEDLRELGARAGARGLRVGYEALAWGRFVNDHREAWEIVRLANHANVGLIVDSFHTLSRGIDPTTLRAVPGDRIFMVQVADAPRIDSDLLSWSRRFRTMPGAGEFPLIDFTRAVFSTGYSGPLSLEIFNERFPDGWPRECVQEGFRSLRSLMEQAARFKPFHAPTI